jgi:hypothetical protein
MGTIKPLAPDEVQGKKNETIPDGVIEAVNEAIVASWNGTSASFTQDEIIDRIRAKIDVSRADIFSRNWLDFEDIFRAAGWAVDYDKPAYNETYAANFTFKKRRGFH